MEAKALYTFTGNPGELSFSKGDTLKILSEGDLSWYSAELNGNDGLVPANYVTFNKPSYFQSVSKTEASNILESSRSGCNYLVRPSESTPGELSLSVKTNCVQHFKILRTANKKKYFLWRDAPEFDSINKLVEYYKHNTVAPNENIYLLDEASRQTPIRLPSKKPVMPEVPKVGRKTVRAMYAFEARTSDELTLCEDDIITVLERIDDEWSKGQIVRFGTTEQGLFPNSYVQ